MNDTSLRGHSWLCSRTWIGMWLFLLGVPALTRGDFNGYEALAEWDSLPRAKTGVTAGLASSYDRDGGNDDYSQYEFPEGLQTTSVDTVVKTLDGPGVITRFWMPHREANRAFEVRMTLDGVPLKIDTNTNTLLDGNFGYMSSPLVGTLVAGR